ncbi:MAG: TlpA disulfide reductase family protein [Bacteroidales bacterium]|nr:TlpA disulfide reductase family protein [Bacteroidales bacterium]
MLSRSLTFLLLFLACEFTLGQSASIHAVSPDYSGQTIHTTIAWNPFMTIPIFSSSTVCSEEGAFSQLIPLEEPRVVQFETGLYQAYLYMEPGYHYEVQFPAYKEKDWDERISPFYQSVALPLTVLSRTSLISRERVEGIRDVNHSIALFDSLFVGSNQKIISQRKLGIPRNSDSLIHQLEIQFANDSSRFFADYRRFRYGALKLNEGKTGLVELCHNYLGPAVMEWHPGFIELFRALFKNFIYYYSGTPEGHEFRNLVNRNQDYRRARELVLQHPAIWSDTLAEMVLLQEFSELFYQGEYHKEAILIMLDSMAHDPLTPQFGVYAMQLKEKLSSLVTGNAPPKISLEDLAGESWTLDDFKGKYTYLFFGTTDHYGCMMEYPFLQSFLSKHASYLNVVTIMVSEERHKLEDFMTRNGYSWTVLHYEGQPEVLDEYMVRAYPTAYLLDRNGKLLLSPAPLPSEGFEQQLFRIMRSRSEI